MLFSLGGGGGGGPRQLVLPGPKAVCSTSTCCRIAGCTCLGISSGLPDNSSDASGPRSITFRDLQPLLQYLFLLGIAVAAPAGPGPEHPGLPAEAPPGTSRPPNQLPAGERWGLSAPLSPGLFRHPHVASRYSQICGHRMPQRGGRPHTHRPPHRPRGHCPECEEFSARPVCQRRADCGEKILAVRRPIAEGAKDETASFHRGDDTGSLT